MGIVVRYLNEPINGSSKAFVVRMPLVHEQGKGFVGLSLAAQAVYLF